MPGRPQACIGTVQIGLRLALMILSVDAWKGVQQCKQISSTAPHVQPYGGKIRLAALERKCVTGVKKIPAIGALSARTIGDGEFETAPSASRRVQDILSSTSFRQLLTPMAAAGAILGPNLDNYHSAFGVLTYKNPIKLSIGGSVLVTTDWWVPLLFAVAGAGIGALYILLDAEDSFCHKISILDVLSYALFHVLETPLEKRQVAWRDVCLCISLFSFQYYLSGLLVASGSPSWFLVISLLVLAERVYRVFDSTRAGLYVSLATAVLGPLIEVLLVNRTDLYVYNNADLLGVDSWIPIVYFCGGPAVGNLARALFQKLLVEEAESG